MTSSNQKPNVLFIICDALRADYLGCYGNPDIQTPNIDRLAKQGMRFVNYYAANPICMPNRASLLTGQYPNTHGVRSNGMIMDEMIPTLVKTLAKRGWHTAAIGKIHHQFWMGSTSRKYKSAEDIASWVMKPEQQKLYPVAENFPLPYYGYEEVEVVSGNGCICSGHYTKWLEKKNSEVSQEIITRCYDFRQLFDLFCAPIAEEYNSSTYITERTIAFLDRVANKKYGDKPFYLHCSFNDPHYPIYPPDRLQERYKTKDMHLPENFNDKNNLKSHKYLSNFLYTNPDAFFKKAFLKETHEEELKKLKALTLASIAYVDECVGKILKHLEDVGQADNTIVIFTSDHGDLMGDHGLLFKGPCPYDGIMKIPLIWRNPDMINSGIVCDSFISSVDYTPTLLTLLGVKPKFHPPNMQGFDMTPLFQNPNKEIREHCYIEADEEMNPMVSRLRHLITKQFKLTVYEEMPGFGDLYDRLNDPLELTNLWEHPNYQKIRVELVEKLLFEVLKNQSRFPRRIAGS
ncbi:MAG: sulfatase-like hydrolase/transferase [Candidatus Lokiarchaeota archaeon]|nr:sulfatase-like hydrolase/transferase [Candidatus Lokiarchaeota archaeon]